MMMGMMTYSKILSYQNSSALEIQFENYMQNNERNYFNEESTARYHDKHYSKSNKGNKTPSVTRNKSVSKLPIRVLLERSQQTVGTEQYETMRNLFKNLMTILYNKESFFQDFLKQYPNALDDLIHQLPEAVSNLPENQSINKPKDLANLNLGNKALNEFFYKMLKGSLFLYETKKGIKEEGFPPLTDFLSLKKGKKLRVYLLPKPLLELLFSQDTVEEIVQARNYLYREVISNHSTPNEASTRFKAMFEGAVNQNIPQSYIDFSVSKTNPKNR